MGARLAWTPYVDGTWLCNQHPVRIPSRPDRSVPVSIEVPGERDLNFDDGWHWHRIEYRPDRELLTLGSIVQAKAFVADNLPWLLDLVAEDYDGDPAAATAERAEKLLAARTVRQRQSRDVERPARSETVQLRGGDLGRVIGDPDVCEAAGRGNLSCDRPAVAVRATRAGVPYPVCARHVAVGEMVSLVAYQIPNTANRQRIAWEYAILSDKLRTT